MPLFKNRSLDEHTNSLAHYLPGGVLFEAKFLENKNQRKYLKALAQELLRYQSIIEEVATEHDIRVTQNLINEWESALGINQTCFADDVTKSIEIRRRNLLLMLNDLHGSTADDFVNLALKLGYNITLESATPHGMFPAQFPIYFFDSGRTVKFTLIVHLAPDDEPVGFPLSFPIKFIKPDNALLRCLFNRMKPANVQLFFIYDKPTV